MRFKKVYDRLPPERVPGTVARFMDLGAVEIKIDYVGDEEVEAKARDGVIVYPGFRVTGILEGEPEPGRGEA